MDVYKILTETAIHQTYRLPGELPNVPSNYGGLYIVTFRTPSFYELGITDPTKLEQSHVSLACANLKRKLDKLAGVMHDASLDGEIRDDKAPHIRKHYNINGVHPSFPYPSTVIEEYFSQEMQPEKFCYLLNLLENVLSKVLPPVYVGIAVDQSFQARIQQHLAEGSPLSSRVRAHGLTWHDFSLVCYRDPHDAVGRKWRDYEKLLQNILKPAFCKQ